VQGDVQSVVREVLVPVAQRLDQLRAAGDTVGARGERFEQAEFACGEFQRAFFYPGPVAWQIQRPGQLTKYHAAQQASEGALHFASGDIANIWAGFFVEAALFLLIAAGAGLFAWRAFKRSSPPTPDMAIEEAKEIKAAFDVGEDAS